MKDFLNRFKNGDNDALVESIIAGYDLIFEAHPARAMHYPPRDKLTVEGDRDKLMFSILSAFKALSPKNKGRFMKNHVPLGTDIAIYSLDQLSNDMLIRMKENLMDIRDEEKDYKASIEREMKEARSKKSYERNMDKAYEDQKIENEYQKSQARNEKQQLLNQKIDSGEIDVDELKRLREDGVIDSKNKYVYNDDLDQSLLAKAEKRFRKGAEKGSQISGGLADMVQGVRDIKNAFSKKVD